MDMLDEVARKSRGNFYGDGRGRAVLCHGRIFWSRGFGGASEEKEEN